MMTPDDRVRTMRTLLGQLDAQAAQLRALGLDGHVPDCSDPDHPGPLFLIVAQQMQVVAETIEAAGIVLDNVPLTGASSRPVTAATPRGTLSPT